MPTLTVRGDHASLEALCHFAGMTGEATFEWVEDPQGKLPPSKNKPGYKVWRGTGDDKGTKYQKTKPYSGGGKKGGKVEPASAPKLLEQEASPAPTEDQAIADAVRRLGLTLADLADPQTLLAKLQGSAPKPESRAPKEPKPLSEEPARVEEAAAEYESLRGVLGLPIMDVRSGFAEATDGMSKAEVDALSRRLGFIPQDSKKATLAFLLGNLEFHKRSQDQVSRIGGGEGLPSPEQARKALEAARTARSGAETPPTPKPPKSTGLGAAPPAEPAVWSAVQSAAQDIERQFQHTGTLPKIPALYDAVKAQQPSLSREDFNKLLLKWQAEDKIILQVANDPHFEPRAAEGIPSDRGLLMYFEMR